MGQLLLLAACSDEQAASEKADINTNTVELNLVTEEQSSAQTTSVDQNIEKKESVAHPNFEEIRHSITYGNANLADVRKAMTQTDIAELTNTMHALYSMRWHRGVYNLMYDLWHIQKNKHPDFAWQAIESTPVRLALASTINRAQIYDTEEWKEFLYAHKYDEHEFHRAQVVVALGLNGDPDDVAYIQEMAAGDNVYVSQSAISSLAIVGHEKARDAMVALYKEFKDDPRGPLLLQLLEQAYDWHLVKPEDIPKEN